jgi:hypothetical protein
LPFLKEVTKTNLGHYSAFEPTTTREKSSTYCKPY